MYCRLTFDIAWRDLLWAAFGPKAKEDARRDVVAWFQEVLPGMTAVTALSVRTLFDAVLAEVKPAPGDPILMSGINIENMLDLARLHALAPQVVDVSAGSLLPEGEDLLEAQARTGAKLCLVAHLFGRVGPVDLLAQLRARGVLTIQDMAQAFSHQTVDRLPDADVTLFSFGPIKRRTALGGAVAVFKDPGLAQAVRARLDSYPALPDGWFRRRARQYLVLKLFSQPVVYGAVFKAIACFGGNPDMQIGKAARGFRGSDLLGNIRKRPPERLMALLARQITDDTTLSRRQDICEAFMRGLPKEVRLGTGAVVHAWWLVPLCVPNPDDLIRLLRRRGFDATRGATSLRSLAPEGPSNAADIIDHIVYLPHPADMNAKSRVRLRQAVMASLNQAWTG